MSWGFKFSLFIIFGVVAAAVGAWEGVFSHQQVVDWIRFGGYWMVLISFVAWVIACWQAYPTMVKKSGWGWLKAPGHRWGIALVLVLFAVIQFKEEKGFKILLDEPVLVNTSRMMHYYRETYVVSNAQRVDGVLAAKGYVDKRPNFFPFLISVVHDLTGYRPENAFYLNAVLTLALFGLTYAVGVQLGGKWVGLLATALIGSVPLVWHQSGGAGFEILNMVMMLLTLKIAIDYLQNPTSEKLSALCLTAVMFAQVRYESILFIVPVGIVGLMGYSLAKKPMLPWGAWVAPLVLIPVLWQQRVFALAPEFWELFTVNMPAPFSIDYIENNMRASLDFFRDMSRNGPNSPLVAWLGWGSFWLVITTLCLKLVGQKERDEVVDNKRPTLVLWVFCLGVVAYYMLLMCYAFDLGRYMIVRLTLPLYLGIALTGGLFFGGWVPQWLAAKGANWVRGWYVFIFSAVAVGVVSFTLPVEAQKSYDALYFPGQEAKVSAEFIKEKKAQGERFLAVADMSMLWTAYEIEALPNRAINNQLALVKYFIEQPNNPPMYVVQSLDYNPATHKMEDMATEPITERAVLKPVWQRLIGSFRILRISRLMDLEGVAPMDDKELFKGNEGERLQEWVGVLP